MLFGVGGRARFVSHAHIGIGCGGFPLFVVHPPLVAVVVASDKRPFFLLFKNLEGVALQELVYHLGPVGRVATHGNSREKTESSHTGLCCG